MEYLDIEDSPLNNIDLSNNPKLSSIDCRNNLLESITLVDDAFGTALYFNIFLNNNKLTTKKVDYVISQINKICEGNVPNGTRLNISGNAAPSDAVADDIADLEEKRWMVIHD